MPTALETLTDGLDEACRDTLGDTIEYAADGSNFSDQVAFVNYRDMMKPMDIGEIIAQDITVEGLLKSDVPAKPDKTARVRLARLSGKTFKPINVRTDDSGTGWDFEVQQVSS